MAALAGSRSQPESIQAWNNHQDLGDAPKDPDVWFEKFRRKNPFRKNATISDEPPTLRGPFPDGSRNPFKRLKDHRQDSPIDAQKQIASTEASVSHPTLTYAKSKLDHGSNSHSNQAEVATSTKVSEDSESSKLVPSPVPVPLSNSDVNSHPSLATPHGRQHIAQVEQHPVHDFEPNENPSAVISDGRDSGSTRELDRTAPSTPPASWVTPSRQEDLPKAKLGFKFKAPARNAEDQKDRALQLGPDISRQSDLTSNDPCQLSPEAIVQRDDLLTERRVFDNTVGPWLRSLMRNSVRGLGPRTCISIALERIPGNTSGQKYFTIVIRCRGLLPGQIRQIERILSKPSRSSGLRGFHFVVQECNNLGFCGGPREYSNTTTWQSSSGTQIEIALPRNNVTLCGVPIRILQPQTSMAPAATLWTCGGLIRVNGEIFGLTTAHPLIAPWPAESYEDNSGFDEGYEELENTLDVDPLLWEPWKVRGRVHQYALSQSGVVPDNCDWLLFNVGIEVQFPNYVCSSVFGGPWIKVSDDRPTEATANLICTVCTSHGSVSGVYNGESAFLIIGGSAFDTMRIRLKEPLSNGDSGSWVVHEDNLIGVIVAADSHTLSGFAIPIEKVMESISVGMSNAKVELPSALDYQIMAYHAIWGTQFNHTLMALYVKKLLSSPAKGDDQVRMESFTNSESPFPELSGYVAIGRLIDTPTERLQIALHRHRHNRFSVWRRTDRSIAKLARLRYGQSFISFLADIAIGYPNTEPFEQRLSYLTLLVEELLNLLRTEPASIPSRNEIRRIVEDIVGWPFSLQLYWSLKRAGRTQDLVSEINVPDEFPPPGLAAQLLLRLYSFDRGKCFFVYEGCYTRWISRFLKPQDAILSRSSDGIKEIEAMIPAPAKGFPRIMLVARSKSSSASNEPYGRIVQCPELDALLLELSKDQTDNRSTKLRKDRDIFEMDGPASQKNLASRGMPQDTKLMRQFRDKSEV